jgi:hypothetical protein
VPIDLGAIGPGYVGVSRLLSRTAYPAECDANPKPFGSTKSADAILAKLDRVMDHPFVSLHWW